MAGFELLSDQGYRTDGRKPIELRRIRCNLGVFTQADGSAYIEQGNTKVLAAIYGPHEPISGKKSQLVSPTAFFTSGAKAHIATEKQSGENLIDDMFEGLWVYHDKCFINCEYSQATFSTADRKRTSRGDRKGQDISAHIKQTFEAAILTSLYPRSQIDIYLQVLHADGSHYSACVNVATLALIDAGIAMKDYICSCSASLAKGTPLIDVNHLEESSDCAEFSAAILPKLNQIVYSELNGRLHADEMTKVVDAVVTGCKDIFVVMERTVREHMEETVSNFTHS